MNHQYIDYMINERRQLEIDACERRRMLKEAGYGGYGTSGLMRRIARKLTGALRAFIRRPSFRKRGYAVHVPVVRTATSRNGEGI